MRKPLVSLCTLALVYALLPSPLSSQISRVTNGAPKYVFLFLVDGGGPTHLEIARQYRQHINNEGMVIIDKIMTEGSVGVMTTHAANSLSTDSAAAATAMASGCKAKIGALGVCADGTVAVSAMEIARRRGMKLGLATNSTIYDASPAAFVCHVPNRKDYTAILRRYLEMAPDILLGGGLDQFLPKGQSGSQRTDDSDLISEFTKLGYQSVTNLPQLQRARSGKVLGLFNLLEMNFELDRDKQNEPSVFDLTEAAIRLLHGPRGFFAFIETENIDRASHANDIASVIHDYREFDRAVGLAYEFYRKYPRDTLIIVASDHESGGLGMTLALKDLSSTKGNNQVAGILDDFKKLQRIEISLQKAAKQLGPNPTTTAVDKLMAEHFPGFNLAPEFREKVVNSQLMSRTIFAEPVSNALGMMVANNTQIYWQNTAHSNHPVLVAALGVGAERFKGYYDNADFGKKLKALMEGKKQ
ncbi:MAG TPA: alkaline phosphatase [Candidatus Binatia bacterium]|nr:alkaline phosphatase [Candidatus Binatia bacterium]